MIIVCYTVLSLVVAILLSVLELRLCFAHQGVYNIVENIASNLTLNIGKIGCIVSPPIQAMKSEIA